MITNFSYLLNNNFFYICLFQWKIKVETCPHSKNGAESEKLYE